MENELSRALAKHGFKRAAGTTYDLAIPPDEDGRIGRKCVRDGCSPAYFKIKNGTGIIENHTVAFCPYCRAEGEPSRFRTEEQVRYGRDHAAQAAEEAVGDLLEKSFSRLNRPTRRSLFTLNVKVDRKRAKPVRRPIEEQLRREVVCPHCGLDHAVFGLAFWCPDCGTDVFLSHLEAEFAVVRSMLADVDRRRELLGARVAARDVENCLEDVVSIFEAVGKALLGRHLNEGQRTKEEIEKVLKKIGPLQSVNKAITTFREHAALEFCEGMEEAAIERLTMTFEKRHPITHNLGVVDRKYLENAMTMEREGRDVSVSAGEVLGAIEAVKRVLSGAHGRLFPTLLS